MAVAKKNTNLYNFPKPIDNDNLIGHQDTLNTFMQAWENRENHPMHHAWILSGPKGIGKATLAYKLAKRVYGNIGDFFIVDLDNNVDESGKLKVGKTITVHSIRNIIEKLQMSSMSGQWRVILIDSINEMQASACNALLKILEEPPAKTLFLIIAHQLSSVLPTIRSRTRIEKLHPLNMTELRCLCDIYLPDTQISDDILRLANGSFGKIANLKNSGGDLLYSELLQTLQNKNVKSADMFILAKKLYTANLSDILLDAVAHFQLADLYPDVTRAITDMNNLNLEPETALYKIMCDIKKCL